MSQEKELNIVELDVNECKYCHEAEGSMIRPCNCNQLVHYSCLEKWQESRTGGKDVCEVCKTRYYGVTIFNWKKCITEYFIYFVLILLNLFVIIGCTGYDIVHDSLYNDNDNSKFEDFVQMSVIMAVLGELLIIVLYWKFIRLNNQPKNHTINLLKILLINTGLQIIPVTICSILLKRFFWNVSTLGMSIYVISVPLMIIAIIGTIIVMIGATGYGIYSTIRYFITHTQSNYSTTLYTNKPEQESDQESDQNV